MIVLDYWYWCTVVLDNLCANNNRFCEWRKVNKKTNNYNDFQLINEGAEWMLYVSCLWYHNIEHIYCSIGPFHHAEMCFCACVDRWGPWMSSCRKTKWKLNTHKKKSNDNKFKVILTIHVAFWRSQCPMLSVNENAQNIIVLIIWKL